MPAPIVLLTLTYYCCRVETDRQTDRQTDEEAKNERDKLKSQYSFSEEQIRWCNNFIESNYCSEVSANLALCNTWRSLVQIKKQDKTSNDDTAGNGRP